MFRFLHIHARAGGEQCFHGGGIAGSRAVHEHGFAVQEFRVWIGFCGEEFLNHRGVPVGARQVERRYAEIVGGVRMGARAQQKIRGCGVIVVNGPVKRGRAITLGGVEIDAGLQQ